MINFTEKTQTRIANEIQINTAEVRANALQLTILSSSHIQSKSISRSSTAPVQTIATINV